MLAILLALLAIGAFVLTMTAEALAEIALRWRVIQVFSLFSGLTATAAAVGLWKRRRWGYIAFVGWVSAVLFLGVVLPLVLSRSRFPWWMSLIWIGLVTVIMLPLARYLRRVLPPPV